MNSLRFAAIAILAMLSGPALAEDQVTGTWRSVDDTITFRAALCGGPDRLCATLVAMKDGTVPILSPLVGQEITIRSKPVGEGAWQVTPLVGLGLVSANVRLTSPGHIEVKGCLAADCRNLAFTRIAR